MTDRKPLILLAEDNHSHAELIHLAIEDAEIDCELIHRADGQAVLDYLREAAAQDGQDGEMRLPDLLLLDLRMPKLDGLEVLEIVKESPELSGIPAVILTSSAAEADLREAYKHHANSYLVKPVDGAEFERVLAAMGEYWLTCNVPWKS